jgi:hypothetical protein
MGTTAITIGGGAAPQLEQDIQKKQRLAALFVL